MATIITHTLDELKQILPESNLSVLRMPDRIRDAPALRDAFFASIRIGDYSISHHIFGILVAKARVNRTTELYNTQGVVKRNGMLADPDVSKKMWYPTPEHKQFLHDVLDYALLTPFNDHKNTTYDKILLMDQSMHVKRARQLSSPENDGDCFVAYEYNSKILFVNVTYCNSRLDPMYLCAASACKKPPTIANPLHKCSGCMLVRYCDGSCQRGDWKNHKPYCLSKKDQSVRGEIPLKFTYEMNMLQR